MSYRLIDANEIANRFPEVNDMDCIYADLPNGLDNGYYDISAERTCEAVDNGGYSFRFECSACGYVAIVHNCSVRLDELPNYCPNCGARVVDVKEGA